MASDISTASTWYAVSVSVISIFVMIKMVIIVKFMVDFFSLPLDDLPIFDFVPDKVHTLTHVYWHPQ